MKQLKRIVRRRSKGFKLPPKTLCISCPSKWSNPFRLYGDMIYLDTGYRQKILSKWVLFDSMPYKTEDDIYNLFRDLLWNPDFYKIESEIKARFIWMRENIILLKNYDYLACWCGLDKKCHSDVLIEYYNYIKNKNIL